MPFVRHMPDQYHTLLFYQNTHSSNTRCLMKLKSKLTLYCATMTMIPSVCFAQSNNNTDTVTKIEHKLFQQTDNMFDHRLFQADVILRSQDAYTSAKLWSNPCHCYNEIDPIAPGPNHPNW